ncbi:MAG: hypothetical protein HWN65_04950 [Candidatus Helarchaeota archaeon]|nr:hypothetical protein [Candidatus Helarchaeota archaeon]
MPKEKLGFFGKLLAKIGKHYYWWRARKMNALMMSINFLECVRIIYEDIHDHNLPAALEAFKELGRNAGQQVIYEFLDAGKRIFSKRLEDFPVILEAAWYIFMGDHISGAQLLPATYDLPQRLVWRVEKCVFCAGLKQDDSIVVNKETMDWDNTRLTWGSVVCGVMESALQAILDYVELPYDIAVEETGCIMKGDPYSEYTAYFWPTP